MKQFEKEVLSLWAKDSHQICLNYITGKLLI